MTRFAPPRIAKAASPVKRSLLIDVHLEPVPHNGVWVFDLVPHHKVSYKSSHQLHLTPQGGTVVALRTGVSVQRFGFQYRQIVSDELCEIETGRTRSRRVRVLIPMRLDEDTWCADARGEIALPTADFQCIITAIRSAWQQKHICDPYTQATVDAFLDAFAAVPSREAPISPYPTVNVRAPLSACSCSIGHNSSLCLSYALKNLTYANVWLHEDTSIVYSLFTLSKRGGQRPNPVSLTLTTESEEYRLLKTDEVSAYAVSVLPVAHRPVFLDLFRRQILATYGSFSKEMQRTWIEVVAQWLQRLQQSAM